MCQRCRGQPRVFGPEASDEVGSCLKSPESVGVAGVGRRMKSVWLSRRRDSIYGMLYPLAGKGIRCVMLEHRPHDEGWGVECFNSPCAFCFAARAARDRLAVVASSRKYFLCRLARRILRSAAADLRQRLAWLPAASRCVAIGVTSFALARPERRDKPVSTPRHCDRDWWSTCRAACTWTSNRSSALRSSHGYQERGPDDSSKATTTRHENKLVAVTSALIWG